MPSTNQWVLSLGVAGGFGRDSSHIGGDAGRVDGTAKVIAVYGSMTPVAGLFADGVVSHGWLDLDAQRSDTSSGLTTRSRRDGQFTAAAVSAGIDRLSGPLQWSVYGRGEYLSGELEAYREFGAGIYDLRFDSRKIRSTTGVLGFKTAYREAVRFGLMGATLRGEWQYEFTGGSRQDLDYADVDGFAFYSLRAQNWSRQQFVLSPGFELVTPSNWEFAVTLGIRAAGDERAATSSVRASKSF
ncbi:autotransporter outer membrane beta-barrel domain-containing protein [Novosphingobium sp. M1R2S20]|uniref:Autotransporter outer membrane beta-barrel domain-containing protein n=1 Tax=Novosphingobium rhizovicinum TaxID=3228928 RepID=A0ABV3R6A9_9SPHN